MNTQDSTKPEAPAHAPMQMVTPKEVSTCEAPHGSSDALIAGVSAAFAAVLASCRKDPEVLYELNPVTLYSSAAEKDKLKSTEQFISILYTNNNSRFSIVPLMTIDHVNDAGYSIKIKLPTTIGRKITIDIIP